MPSKSAPGAQPAASDDAGSARETPAFADAVKDSAQQIWRAGLGAFAKAQGEGARVFESLAQEGLAIQRKTQAAAEERLAEVTERMGHLSTGMQARAGQQWDRLESIFEDRVARSLTRLGVPSAADLQALGDRIEALNERIDRLTRTAAQAEAEAPKARSRKLTSKPAKAPTGPAATGRASTRGAQPAAPTTTPSRKRST